MSSEKYAHFYQDVPPIQRDEYLTFREMHPFQSKVVDGVIWDYIDTDPTQKDTTPLLILVGGLRVADAAYRAITILKTDRRIIVPSYPALTTMAALTDGIIGLLVSLDIKQVDVLSGSFGGMVAQVLVQRHAPRLRNLVLSSTGLMSESAVRQRKKSLRLFRLFPNWAVRRLTERRLFTIINPPADAVSFWRAYLKELFANRLSKAHVMSTIACMIDFGEHFNWSGDEPLAPTGNVFIIGSMDDPTFGDTGHQSLLTIFPSAQIFSFSDAGHSPSMTQTQAYFGQISEFLQT